MKKLTQRDSGVNGSLPKAATGIQGLDEVTGGGFPRGRPTLICGSAGAGKTLLAMEFLVRGATQYILCRRFVSTPAVSNDFQYAIEIFYDFCAFSKVEDGRGKFTEGYIQAL